MSLEPEPALLDVSSEGIAVVTLNRPAKRNAFDELMIAALSEHFETLKGADHVRAVLAKERRVTQLLRHQSRSGGFTGGDRSAEIPQLGVKGRGIGRRRGGFEGAVARGHLGARV